MTLKKYKKKRDFKKSSEPSGKKESREKKLLKFVVQKHAARQLHYDFRLEKDGVLKSWAVPKGPSMDPEVKRLAIQVEDHPLEYADFEGVIPKGQYGAGKVEIWDHGTYIPHLFSEDEIKVTLNGEKLNGDFVLVKLKNKENEWLLIKKKDEFSKRGHTAEEEDEVDQEQAIYLSGVKRKMPHHVGPMLASLAKNPFDHHDWIFEIKWDGYRAIAEVSPNKIELYSRNLKSFAEQFPPIIRELRLFDQELILDGEIVVLDREGKSDFQLLQNYIRSGDGEGALRYFVFDLLYYAGRDLRDLPLIERKTLLKEVISRVSTTHILYNDHVEEMGTSFFAEIRKEKMEGLIAKHKQSHYVSKRSQDWLKIKSKQTEEAIIVGYTEPQGGRKKFGSLLLGQYRDDVFTFVGHVGVGFSDQDLDELFSKLQPYVNRKCPFNKVPTTNTPVTWVKPHFMCEVEFQEWTKDGIMRQPVFKRLRDDQKPKESEKSISFLKKDKSSEIFSNLDKIFWHKEKYTKGDLLKYYESISSYLLPHLEHRPQVLHRFPDGIEGKSFYQKEAPEFIPDWMETTSVEHTDRVIHYLLIKDTRSLLYVVNLGCIEIHPFTSQIPNIDYPDYVVLDLDPEAISFQHVVKTAKLLHQILDEVGVPNYCKTSGKRGLHVFVPLGKLYTYDQAETFAHLLAKIVHQRLPETTSLIRDPKKRQKKVYIDYLQNSRTKTIVAPYSVRPVPKALVSNPLSWDEVNKELDPTDFTIQNLAERLKKVGDHFKPLLNQNIDMAKVIRKIENLL